MSMKKSITAVSFILAVLMVITMLTACADNSIPAQTTPTAPTVEAAPAESAQPVDPLVGAWRFPPSPYGDDFSVYVVLIRTVHLPVPTRRPSPPTRPSSGRSSVIPAWNSITATSMPTASSSRL